MKNLLDPDARLFDLHLWRRRLSDAEYVEQVRKNLQRMRWGRYLLGVSGLGVIVVSCLAIQAFLDLLVGFGAGQQQLIAGAIVAAVIVGLGIGFSLMSFIHSVATMVFLTRRDQLLVDCWDALDRLLTERRQCDK